MTTTRWRSWPRHSTSAPTTPAGCATAFPRSWPTCSTAPSTCRPVPIPASAAGAVGAGQAAPAEPELLARLREAEFIDYDVPEGEGDVVRLPASGLRIVVVSGPDASVPLGDSAACRS